MLWKNHAENVHQKLVPDSFLILVNETKQPFYAGNCFKNKSLLEDYQKALEKLTLFFFSNQVLFHRQNYQKQKGPGTSDQFLFRSQNKFRKFLY